MKLMVLTIAAVLFVGCASVPKATRILYTEQLHRNYKLSDSAGSSAPAYTVSVGDPIFEVERSTRMDGYEAVMDFTPPSTSAAGLASMTWYPIKQGMVFPVTQKREDTALGLESDSYKVHMRVYNWTTKVFDESDNPVTIWIYPDGSAKMNDDEWGTAQLFRPTREPVRRGNWFRAEMIYTGMDGRTLKAMYREYVNDYARPAFTTELQFNLDESKIIRYKTVQIEVLEASNTSVKLRVLSDDNLPWVK